MKKLGIMIIAVAMVATTAVQAETLALWDLDGTVAGSMTAPVDTTHSNMSSTALTGGSPSRLTSTGWSDTVGTLAETWRLSTNLVYAISTNNYFGFTLTADAGKMVSYTNLFIRCAVNTGSSPSSDVTFHLLSDQTGFEAEAVLGTYNITNAASGHVSTIFTHNFDLSAVPELQEVQGATEFRIYFTSAAGNRMAIGHDNFANGTDDLRVEGIIENATSLPVVTLAEWDLDGTVAGSMTAPVDLVHSNISSTALIGGSPSRLTSTGWSDTVGTLAETWRLGGYLEYAISTNDYFGFTLTPDAGKRISYKKLFARFAVNTGSAATSDVTFHLLSSKTGFTMNDALGVFNATNAASGYASTIFTHEFDLSTFPELQDLAEPTEFRIYFTSFAGNRMAIGHDNSINGSVDLRVEGSIEELPYVPATIVSWTSISDSVMKLVIDAPADPAFYYPKGSTDLTLGFSSVAHSDNAAGPFEITNLTVSATEGDNEVIFVETTADQKFFGIGEE